MSVAFVGDTRFWAQFINELDQRTGRTEGDSTAEKGVVRVEDALPLAT